MLPPQTNPFRQSKDISGFWDFLKDPADIGKGQGWSAGFSGGRSIGIPGSWNDQFEDTRDYTGTAWYQTQFERPWGWDSQRVFIRFNSVNYLAEVWLNGVLLGAHEGGHLPFVFEITDQLNWEKNLLVVRVDGALKPDRVPPGNITPFDPRDAFANTYYPDSSFDFFPYCGIQRSVVLFTTPRDSVSDVIVTTDITGSTGKVDVQVLLKGKAPAQAKITLSGYGQNITRTVPLDQGSAAAGLTVPKAKFWDAGSPCLYQLTVELLEEKMEIDRVTIPVGIRTIRVKGDKVLLNGKPVFLKGFGRHEDFPIVGRYMPRAVIVKDYDLMRWTGANSFRTSHYPYDDSNLELADKLGVLVISETPAVGLFFRPEGTARRLELCRQFTREMIERDRNHPSVVMWSVADEPHSKRPGSLPFLKDVISLAKKLDPTRPVTFASDLGTKDPANRYCDVVCMNRYFGWYSEPGDLDLACRTLSKDLDAIHSRFKKPVLMTEFGADALPGHHADPPEMFSEEYQADFIERYLKVLSTKSYVVGAQIWNLCDFKTSQATHRPGAMNWKGVFTRDRRPKLAAHRLRALWFKTKA